MRRAGLAWFAWTVCFGACASAPPPVAIGAVPPAPDEPFRARAPGPESEPAYQIPPASVIALSNGMQLIVVERHAAHLVFADLVFPGGASGLRNQSSATMWLLAHNLTVGPGSHADPQVFADMDAHFIDGHTAMWDAEFEFSLRAPSPWFDQAIRIMHAVALQPAFPVVGLEASRLEQTGNIEQEPDNQDLIARRNLFVSLYGLSHPYTRINEDRRDEIAKVTRDDLERLRQAIMDPAGATLVVVGDVDPAAVHASVEAAFGAWKHDPAYQLPAPAPTPAPTAARLIVVDHPGARQATVVYGATLPGSGAPTRAAETVVYDLLGGMRSSALASKVRDQLGAAWRQGVMHQERKGWNTAWWYGSVAPERTADVLRALDGCLGELRARGPNPDELAVAKSARLRALPHAFETDSQMARSLGMAAVLQLPIDQASRTMAALRAVTAADVRAAAPDPLAVRTVVVGDLQALKAQLLALGWGPIELHDDIGHVIGTLAP